jgi:hypothetical protein
MVSRRAQLARPRTTGPCVPPAPNVRVSPGVCLPPTSATGADVTADAACPGAPVIVDRYLAHKEVTVHGNPDADLGARIAPFAGLRRKHSAVSRRRHVERIGAAHWQQAVWRVRFLRSRRLDG